MIGSGYPQQVTYWANTGESLYGAQNAFAAPIVIEGRWEDRQEQAIGMNGEEFVTKAVVYVARAIELGSYLAEGDQTSFNDPTIIPGAHEVKSFSSIPDLRNVVTERKALL